MRQEFRGQTIKFFEKKYQELLDAHETTLLQHFQLRSKNAMVEAELAQMKQLHDI